MENKWFTSTGDDGYTGVLGRERVPKYAERPEAYGTVDEVSAVLGLARAQAQDPGIPPLLLEIQRDLYKMMADLATLPEAAKRPAWLAAERVRWLEQIIARYGERVEMPREFIVPGDSLSGATLDVGRTVARRAERLVARLAHMGEMRDDTPLKYLNRLSSLLFLLARVEDQAAGAHGFTLATDE